MPRATADRPSRRLEAILGTLRRHGVRTFRAAQLPGIGEGIQVDFEDTPPTEHPDASPPGQTSYPDLANPQPMDELALVAEGREGLPDANGVS
jgi:hypothetical protein